MALAFTVLDSGTSTGSATSLTSASISPAAGSLLIAFLSVYDGGINVAADPTSVTVTGLTLASAFSKKTSKVWGGQASPFKSGFRDSSAWAAVCDPTTPGSGTVKFTFAASQTRWNYVIVQVTGQDATTPVVQSQNGGTTGGASAGSGSVTMNALAGTSNATLALFSNALGVGFSPGTGYTELSDIGTGGGAPLGTEVAYKVNDNTPSASWSGSAGWGGIALEIAVAAAGSPPVNTVAPAVTGTAQVGQTLTTDNGTWTNSPTSYSYQWQRSNDGSTGWANIGAATASSYLLASGDSGKYIRCVVTATNGAGSTAANSNVVGPIGAAPSAPSNTVAPAASGTTYVTQTLSTDNGTWTNSPTGYTYQWQRSSDGVTGWASIGGATASSYTLVSADLSKYIRCVVTATNGGGSTAANSNVLGPVTNVPPPPTAVGHLLLLDLNDPTNATRNYVDISQYLRTFDLESGKQHELDRIEAGTFAGVLNNKDRRFDPLNTAGPYYPHLKPEQRLLFAIVVSGVAYTQFDGYVDRWPQHPQGRYYSQIELTASDGFEPMKNMPLISDYASLTTGQGSNRDITYTAQGAGYEGDSISVEYIQQTGNNADPSVTVDELNIIVYLATDGSGNPASRPNGIMPRINTDPIASGLVVATLAPGSAGTGIMQALAQTYLAGGTFEEELSGQRIADVLDAGGWSATKRALDDGQSLVQAQDFPIDGSSDVLTHCQDVADSELGWFFMDRNGNAAFFDRHHLISAPFTVSQMTLVDHSGTDGGTTEPYMGLVADYDKDLLWNKWVVTRVNGQAQTAEDATSEGQYYTRRNTRSPLITSDLESLMQAEYLLALTKQPALRFEPIQMRPGNDLAFWALLCQRDLGDRLTVVWQPPGGGLPIIQPVNLAHRHISGGPGKIQATTVFEYQVLPVAAFPPSNVWTLDDSTLGKLDQNILSY